MARRANAALSKRHRILWHGGVVGNGWPYGTLIVLLLNNTGVSEMRTLASALK